MAALTHSINFSRRQIPDDLRILFEQLTDITYAIKYTGLVFVILFSILALANALTLVLLKKDKRTNVPIILVFCSATLYTISYGIMWEIQHLSKNASRNSVLFRILGDVFLLNALYWTTFMFTWVFFGINTVLLVVVGIVRTWMINAQDRSDTAVNASHVLPSVAVLIATGLLEFYAFKAHKKSASKNRWTNWLRAYIGPVLILAAVMMVALSIAYAIVSPDPEATPRDGPIIQPEDYLTLLRVTEGQLIAWGVPTMASIIAFLVYMWKFYPSEHEEGRVFRENDGL